jgi:hypothetical protein
MARKICHESLAALFAVAMGVTALAGCDQEKPVVDAPGEPVTVQRSAVTAAATPTRAATLPPGAYRESDIRPLPAAAVQGLSQPAAQRLPGQPKGFVAAKPAAAAAVAPAAPPSPPPAQYVAKQNEYLRQWNALQPTLGKLSEGEQNARRAALKRQVLGE